jgi:hypothetical protein
MKKRANTASRFYPFPVKLTRKDLEDLAALIRETAPEPARIRVETEDYELENLEELFTLPEEAISSIRIYSLPEASIVVNIDERGSLILRQDSSALLDAAFDKICSTIRRGKRRFLNASRKYFLAILTHLPFWVIFFSQRADTSLRSNLLLNITMYASLAIALLWATLNAAARTRNQFNKIMLKDEAGRRTFWKRNRDQIIVGLIVALLTAIVSIPAGIAIGRLTR